MIEFCTLTGEIENGMVGCKSFGKFFFARPVFGTAFQSIPSQMWLNKWKDHYFGLVTYENRKGENSHDRPLFLGVVPVKKAENQGSQLEDKHKINTAKYRVHIDDTNEHLTIERFNGVSIHIKGDNVFIGSRKINLGKETADYKAVLGDIAQVIIETFAQIMMDAKVLTMMGPQPFMPPTQIQLQQLKNRVVTMLSQIVRLD